MKQVITGFGVFAVVIVAAAFLLPWKNVNWGRINWTPAELVSVTGEAKSQEKNQIASFTAGVNAINDKKEDAVKEVNDKVGALIEAAKKFGIAPEDIKTQNLSVYQQEEMYYDNGRQKTRQGQWRVSNSVEITLRQIDKASELSDLLTGSGANNVYGPNFRFDDTNKMEKDLFDAAMKDAREKAELIAKASGRKLGKVISVNEGAGSGSVYPMFEKAAMGMGGAGAPVEPGSGTVSKSLNVSFELK